MPIAVRYQTLLKLAISRGWGFAPTQFRKDHLLIMRRKEEGHLVRDTIWNHPEVLKDGIRAAYSEKLANFYCITTNGFSKLCSLFPSDYFNEMKTEFFDKIFVKYDPDWIKFRMNK